MRFPANCLVVALVMAALTRGRPRMMRNRFGRPHFYWTDRGGLASEFYAKGRAGRGLLRNSLYLGAIKRCPSLDVRDAA